MRSLLSGAPTPDDPLRAIELKLEGGGSEEEWLVYGDALLSAGDVRGKLVASASNNRQFKALLKKHARELFGVLTELDDEWVDAIELTWRG